MPPLHLVSLFLFALFGPEPGESVLTRWADLMRGCEGDCYYYPEVDGTVVTSGIGRRNHECKNFIHGKLGGIDSGGLPIPLPPGPCRYVVSIQPYLPTCDTFDRQPLNDRLCQYFNNQTDPQLYLITVAQRFPIHGCNMHSSRNPPFDRLVYFNEISKDPTYQGDCNVWDENVAFTFSTTPETDLTLPAARDDKIYYVCTNEGITAYPFDSDYETEDLSNSTIKFPPKSERITLAAPYADSPPGILWYEVTKPRGERTIICSFVMSTNRFTYRTSTWKVGVIGGREVARHEILPGMLRPQFIHYGANSNLWIKVATAKIKRYYYSDSCMGTVSVVPCAVLPEIEEDDPTIVAERIHTKWITRIQIRNVERSDSTIALLRINRPRNFEWADAPINPVVNADVLGKISSIYASCRDKHAMCFNFPWEEGCQSREKCHMLLVIRQVSNFQRLHIDMLTHPNSPHPVVTPYSNGWMGFAFSEDAKMGGEGVFTCAYKGRAGQCANPSGLRNHTCARIYITMNLDHPQQRGIEKNNYYSEGLTNPDPAFGGDYTRLIEDPKVDFAQVPSESEARVLCSWNLKTSDYNTISAYPKRPNEVFRYDLLNKEYYILLATGRSVIGNWHISYHGKGNRASGSNLKFSRKIYEDTVVPGGTHAHPG